MNQRPDKLNDLNAEHMKASPLLQWLIPIAVVAVVALVPLVGLVKASGSGELARYDFDALAEVPVSEDGRVKPFDSVARNALLMVSGKQSLTGEMLLDSEERDKVSATEWLIELMAVTPRSMQMKVIRIDDPEVLGLIDKTPEDGKFYALNDFTAPLKEGEKRPFEKVNELAQRASRVRDDERSKFEEHVIGLARKLSLLGEFRAFASPFLVLPEAERDWEPLNDRGAQGGPAADSVAWRADVRRWIELKRALDSEEAAGQAELIETAIAATEQRIPTSALNWLQMIEAYGNGDEQRFNAKVKAQLTLANQLEPGPTKKAAFEVGYNRFAPFVQGIALYILAGLLGLLSLLLRPLIPEGWYRALWRSGMGVLLLVFVIHTAALVVRIWLQGRPPVTNLYSSAVFIGWGVVGGAILLEKITKIGVASLAASSCGVATLIVAHHLSKDGDTMGVMQAVLDSNFWLGTHVITITLGYSATFLAGFIALCYIIFGMTTPLLDRKAGRAMAGMVYAVICFALLFSFVGTVLGGIWADQSWGRFWGWDPKENGAILIVLMNAIILHARWGHLIKERGLMVLALGGNIVTIWSWFGTNLLGVGLHSYGFMDGAMFWLAIIIANHLMIMSAAMFLPTHLWMSFSRQTPGSAAALSCGKQIAIAIALLSVGVGFLVLFAVLTLLGKLPSAYWFAACVLLFSTGAGIGLLVDGLKRWVDEGQRGVTPAAG